ncbi:hypothetical protein V6R21_04675 [Limibacter armeniacum]|uniref:hypothetical protein n=1 Tax=Limibacter armeniacum TaxID=466084 RepID=UPI002FE52024
MSSSKEIQQSIYKAFKKLDGNASLDEITILTGYSQNEVNQGIKSLIKDGHLFSISNRDQSVIYNMIFQPLWKRTLRKVRQSIRKITKSIVFQFVRITLPSTIYFYHAIALSVIAYILVSYSFHPFVLHIKKALEAEVVIGILLLVITYFCLRWFFDQHLNYEETMDIPTLECDNRKRSHIHILQSFLLGDQYLVDEEESVKHQVVAYLHKHEYLITVANYMTLTGSPKWEATESLTKLLIEFDGNVYVTENGTIVYDFSEVENLPESKFIYDYCWNRHIHNKAWNINTRRQDQEIYGILIKILLFSVITTLLLLNVSESWTSLLNIIFGVLPLVLSTLFLSFSFFNRRRHYKKIKKQLKSNGIYQLLYKFCVEGNVHFDSQKSEHYTLLSRLDEFLDYEQEKASLFIKSDWFSSSLKDVNVLRKVNKEEITNIKVKPSYDLQYLRPKSIFTDDIYGTFEGDVLKTYTKHFKPFWYEQFLGLGIPTAIIIYIILGVVEKNIPLSFISVMLFTVPINLGGGFWAIRKSFRGGEYGGINIKSGKIEFIYQDHHNIETIETTQVQGILIRAKGEIITYKKGKNSPSTYAIDLKYKMFLRLIDGTEIAFPLVYGYIRKDIYTLSWVFKLDLIERVQKWKHNKVDREVQTIYEMIQQETSVPFQVFMEMKPDLDKSNRRVNYTLKKTDIESFEKQLLESGALIYLGVQPKNIGFYIENH